jgi:hypothetical protein
MAQNLPALRAEESLRRSSEMSVATGHAENAREIVRSWESDANGGPRIATRDDVALFAAMTGMTLEVGK